MRSRALRARLLSPALRRGRALNANVAALVERAASRCVLVVGDVLLDSYLSGAAVKLCPEAPVPAIEIGERRQAPGAAANVAANVASLGGRCLLVSLTGRDVDGDALRRVLAERDVALDHLLADGGRATIAKQRVIADGQVLLRLDSGSTAPLQPAAAGALRVRLEQLWHQAEAVVVSDYGYGVWTQPLREALARLRRVRPLPLVVDARNLADWRDVRPDAVKPNFREALGLVGTTAAAVTTARPRWVAANAEAIMGATGATITAVTLDADGAVVLQRGRQPIRSYALTRGNAAAVGAGDTYAAALGLALAAGADAAGAAELAAAAAAVVVSKPDTATCDAAELTRTPGGARKRLSGLAELARVATLHRAGGERIAFTNGCFDLIHRGHVSFLEQAKALADVLVVGVNSDESVSRLKGPARPVTALDDRLDVLTALSSVDYVLPFEEDTPLRLIRTLAPDVFVKGGDYTRETLPEAGLVEALGGTVQLLPYLQERSTSRIITMIRSAPERPPAAVR